MKAVIWTLSVITALVVVFIAVVFWGFHQGALLQIGLAVTGSLLLFYTGIIWILHIRMAVRDKEVSDTSRTDPITGLMNIKCMIEAMNGHLKSASRHNYSFGLIHIGLDQFKEINQRFGRKGGDTILRHVGQFLLQQCRESDLVAYFHGDEFLIGATHTDLDGVTILARRIHKDLTTNQFPAKGGKTRIHASIGVAAAPPNEYDTELLIHLTEGGLKKAKAAGRNCIHVDEA
jgi:diguanylate cyclase (GGDEF)-like protein